jgi:hypothetical protein
MTPFSSLEVTRRTVVVCDLKGWRDAESPGWEALEGSQDEVGRALAARLAAAGVRRLDDFGGVAEAYLREGGRYREAPPRTRGHAAVFSFTPRSRIAAEGLDMARVSSLAGYELMVLTVKKHGPFGKVWTLCGALRHLSGEALVCYEDTAAVVDELKQAPEGRGVTAVHVRAPGFEMLRSRHADRTISQAEYLREVLA